MKARKKRNKWVQLIIAIVAVGAIYIAFDIACAKKHYNRGTNFLVGGDYDQAIACFDKAIEVEGEFAQAYYNRGMAYYEKGDHDRAIEDFNRAIELNPESADAYHNRAMVYFDKEDYDKTWTDVHKAQSLGHQFPADFLEALRGVSGRQQ